eukprot:TRINITY_DN1674_c0_g3_i1.p1 TRINITY_DN1674_c0_g3~~TRINITY_DN1674_c0_g3_i1.p1  ORF type:complete len:106 (-),score=18.76 TRINITY_DN1674_c0_g3_i1:23-340(-)
MIDQTHEATPPEPVTTSEHSEPPAFFKDVSQLHPLLSDFEAVEQDAKSTFPYKWIVYGGNYWDTVTKVIRPRGFNLVKTKDDDKLEDISFIWKPLQFSYLVTPLM